MSAWVWVVVCDDRPVYVCAEREDAMAFVRRSVPENDDDGDRWDHSTDEKGEIAFMRYLAYDGLWFRLYLTETSLLGD